MKKNNGGYILPYVLVVMTILSLVAVSIMSNTLMGLQTQQKSIERMEAKYAAEGEIEKINAQLLVLDQLKISEPQESDELSTEEETLIAADRIKSCFDAKLKELCGDKVDFLENKSTYSDKIYTCQLITNDKVKGATIGCTLNYSFQITTDKSDPDTNGNVTYTYTITSPKVSYGSYAITYQ